MKKLFTLLLIAVAALTLKSSAQTTNCTADFSFTLSGMSVTFTPANAATLATNHHYWRFDDGSSSSSISPVHVYAAGGTHTVTHIFYRSENGVALCIDSVTKRFEFPNTPVTCNLQAHFSFERDPQQANKLNFKNLSTPTTDVHYVKWSFGDGTYSSDLNPSHVYANSGTYHVCLSVATSTNTANGCYSDSCMSVQVQATPPPCNLTAYFAWSADSLQINKIHFTNFSSHFEKGDSIRWTFGDGTTSYDVNPTHVYANGGTYTVCIRVKKNGPSGAELCVKEYCKQVVVLNECRLEANFTFEADATNKNKIYFKNGSTPLTSVIYTQWSFGDGTTSSSANPDHTYAKPGIYNVCLKISSSSNCYREKCQTVEIREPEINCFDISKFTFTRSTVNCLEFKFIPAVVNTSWKYAWSFGDGTGSNDISPSHVYPRSGNYTVFLTVYRSSTCVSTSYKVAETGTCFSCNNIWVKYEYSRVAGTANKIYFHALSNYPILSQTWTITKLSISGASTVTLTQTNPDYTFNEPGDYRVCIRAITYGQCIKEYCDVIHIAPNTDCALTLYPNPSNTNQVAVGVVLTAPDMIHVYIYNSLNILVKQKDQQGSVGNNVVAASLDGLVPGTYTVKVVYGNRMCYTKFHKI